MLCSWETVTWNAAALVKALTMGSDRYVERKPNCRPNIQSWKENHSILYTIELKKMKCNTQTLSNFYCLWFTIFRSYHITYFLTIITPDRNAMAEATPILWSSSSATSGLLQLRSGGVGTSCSTTVPVIRLTTAKVPVWAHMWSTLKLSIYREDWKNMGKKWIYGMGEYVKATIKRNDQIYA